MNKLEIKKQLKESLEDQYEIPMTSLGEYSNYQGNLDMLFPIKKEYEYNGDTIMVTKVSQEFADAVWELVNEGFCKFNFVNPFEYNFFGAPIYNLPILSNRNIKNGKTKFIPTTLVKL